LNQGTSAIQLYSFKHKQRTITLVDTPGFNDTNRSDFAILKEISDWTTSAYEQHRLLSGVIYLHRITDVRMEGTALRNLSMFHSLCGDKATGNVILTTSHWGNVNPAVGNMREKELLGTESFWGSLIADGAKTARFSGDAASGLELVDKFMGQEKMAMQIQVDIVDDKKAVAGTAAGVALDGELHIEKERLEADLKMLKEQQQVMDKNNVKLQQLVADQKKEMEQKIAKIETERNEMQEELNARDNRIRKLFEQIKKDKEELNREIAALKAELKDAQSGESKAEMKEKLAEFEEKFKELERESQKPFYRRVFSRR
jgi:hypothetical protein